MKNITDVSNREIRDFLQCSNVHASRIRHGKRTFPRKRAVEFSEKFGVPLKQLVDGRNKGV